MNKKIIQLCLGYIASAFQAFLLNLQLLGQDIFIFCRPRSLLWCCLHPKPVHKHFVITAHYQHSLPPAPILLPISVLFPSMGDWVWVPPCSGDFPSLDCKGALSNRLPFVQVKLNTCSLRLDIFSPNFIISLFSFSVPFYFSGYVFLFFKLKLFLFFLIEHIHILLSSLLPLHSLKVSHCCVLPTEVGKVYWDRLTQSALWHCFQAGVESSRFWHRWCSLFLNSSQTRVMLI